MSTPAEIATADDLTRKASDHLLAGLPTDLGAGVPVFLLAKSSPFYALTPPRLFGYRRHCHSQHTAGPKQLADGGWCCCCATLLPPSGAGTQLDGGPTPKKKCRSPSASSQMRLVVLFDKFPSFLFQHVVFFVLMKSNGNELKLKLELTALPG